MKQARLTQSVHAAQTRNPLQTLQPVPLMQLPQAVTALGALAHTSRLNIFRQLVVAGSLGVTPTVLSESLDIAPTGLSFHLKELGAAGLVNVERQGRHLIYRANMTTMNQLLHYLTDNCCGGQPCLTSLPTVCESPPL